jgi:hypothetical protein
MIIHGRAPALSDLHRGVRGGRQKANSELPPRVKGVFMATRRANGESSIFKGPDDRWHGWVSLGYRLDGRVASLILVSEAAPRDPLLDVMR